MLFLLGSQRAGRNGNLQGPRYIPKKHPPRVPLRTVCVLLMEQICEATGGDSAKAQGDSPCSQGGAGFRISACSC